jgi:MHS family proline/betaine transporter-like MFS transporter
MSISEQRSLTREQKEAVGLLSIGTMLEYFDLMLYVHMAVLLNELFFPKTDAHTTALLSAFAFCSSFIFRPFAALLFGWLGDNIGRKATVIITTFLMSISCVIMANLPTYEQIGISAAWLVTLCRMLQGASSMGEVIGAELYLTETIKPPLQYFYVALMVVANNIGIFTALGVAFLVTSFGLNWRLAFWIGAVIALVGAIARTNLRETPEFVDAKKRINNMLKAVNLPIDKNIAYLHKVSKRHVVSYFLIECACPLWFCISYVYCSNLLKTKFGFTPEEIISHNFLVSIIDMFFVVVLMFLVKRFHPIKVLSIRLLIYVIPLLFIANILDYITTPFELLIFQGFILLAPAGYPAQAVFYGYFPVLHRFKCSSLIFATSRALMYILSSFGLVLLTDKLGYNGLMFLVVPIILGYSYGLINFIKSNSIGFNLQRLEKEKLG